MLWILAQACSLGLDATGSMSDQVSLDGVAMDSAEAEDIEPSNSDAPTTGTDGGTESSNDGEQPSTEDPVDLDGDGYGADDCDDDDPEIFPGQFDACDSMDNDCDGQVDEDAIWDEEPSSPIMDMGEVFGGDVIELDGLLFPEFDKDVYEFHVHDGLFGWFFIDALAESVSTNTDIKLTLVQIDEETGSTYEFVFNVDDVGPGEPEYLSYNGRPMVDDSGTYQLEITSMYGSDCEVPYYITLEIGT